MTKERYKRLIGVAAGGLCGLAVLTTATASPPFLHGRSSLSTIDSARPLSVASRPFARQGLTPTTQLDLGLPGEPLRLPGEPPAAIIHGGVDALALVPFPSSIHHADLGKFELDTDDRIHLPAFVMVETTGRVMSPAEILARRLHRERLPVVRLWQFKSAVFSIGLNQKGKPGLWLTQKVH